MQRFKGQSKVPPSQVTTKTDSLTKQPIMKCRPKEEHLPGTKQTNIYMQAMIQWVSTSIDYLISMYKQLQQ